MSVEGKFTSLRLAQYVNAKESIFATPSGMVIFSNAEAANMDFGISVRPAGKVTCLICELLNTPAPIFSTASGIFISVRLLLEKASSPIVFRVAGNVTPDKAWLS